LALTEILGRSPADKVVVETRRKIPMRGWVHQLLSSQNEQGYWITPNSCYMPKYSATVWQLQLLAMLAMDSSDARIGKACERFLAMHVMPDGGFTCSASLHPNRRSEECITGRMVAVLTHFGYQKDARVRDAVGWLLDHQLADGGWNCRSQSKPRHSSMYSTYMAVWGLSKIGVNERTETISNAIERGAEFMLLHRLFKSHRTGRIIEENWLDFHFPPVGYDILLASKLVKDLGILKDDRLTDSIGIIKSKMQPDGKWLVDSVLRGYQERAGEATTKLETQGKPSKWITLQAITVLSRVNAI
jgi:hypothetical protein